MKQVQRILNHQTLSEYSTLDIETATMRITQIRVRPSVDVDWYRNPPAWFKHFLEMYHKTGKRNAFHYTSDDNLTKVTQIYWIDQASWRTANTEDPVVIENTKRSDVYYASVGITQTKIMETKIHGKWYAYIKTSDDNGWNHLSLGDMVVKNPNLLGNATVSQPLLNYEQQKR